VWEENKNALDGGRSRHERKHDCPKTRQYKKTPTGKEEKKAKGGAEVTQYPMPKWRTQKKTQTEE